MKLFKSGLNDEEKKVWAAAYAAAFVDQFRKNTNVLAEMGVPPWDRKTGVYLFDRAIEGNAESAITIADQALEQLRRWRKEEGFGD